VEIMDSQSIDRGDHRNAPQLFYCQQIVVMAIPKA
jgi:hypothetical protein